MVWKTKNYDFGGKIKKMCLRKSWDPGKNIREQSLSPKYSVGNTEF